MVTRARLIAVLAPLLASGCAVSIVNAQHERPDTGAPAAVAGEPPWQEAEQGILANAVQLTRPDRFAKAGEAYFSPDGARIIFQAIEAPPPGREPDEFYAMYVADLSHDARGRITGLSNVRCISPPGSFNTCGWFDQVHPGEVIFASTLTAPSTGVPGYQRAGHAYRWQFPPEMNIYRCDLSRAAEVLEPLVVNDRAYLAECSLSSDGRQLLYTSLETGGGDIYISDLKTGTTALIVGAPGYDGGPFFSPDDRRICYRSDRRGDDMLQVMVGDLAFNDAGSPVGLSRVYQVTDDGNVNFAPFWHPDGRYLVFCSSEMGHRNYEIFLADADPGGPGSAGPIRYGTGRRRVTHAPGFDGFPAFNRDGSKLLVTSQRDGSGSSQVWVADFAMDVDAR